MSTDQASFRRPIDIGIALSAERDPDRLMAGAVDAESLCTGGHCQLVPALTDMPTQAACKDNSEPFAHVNLTEEEWYVLHIGAWLHDSGTVETPNSVLDKATKPEAITDRIHEIRMRFEVAKRVGVAHVGLKRREWEPARDSHCLLYTSPSPRAS